MTVRHTVDSITSDALDQLYDRLARAEAAIARVRAVAGWAIQGWSDLSPEKVLLAVEGEQPAPAPAATQATEPREHCGHFMPAWSIGPRNECVLQPGHQGSHADDRGARWWYDPTGENSQPCTCGGRFPLQHLHADQHHPKEQP